jgi:hypothetical protein
MLPKSLLSLIFLVVVIIPSYAMPEEKLDYKPGEVIICFKKDKSKSITIKEKQALIDKIGGGKMCVSPKIGQGFKVELFSVIVCRKTLKGPRNDDT